MNDQLTEADARAAHRRRILYELDALYAEHHREPWLIDHLVAARLQHDAMVKARDYDRTQARIARQRLERALRDVAPDHPLLTPLRAVEPIRGDG